MTSGEVTPRSRSPLRRAHQSLSVLLIVSILAAGGVTASITAEPSPVAGIGFAASAVLLAISGTLSVRVVVALERVRRMSRAPVKPLPNAPLFNKLMRSLHRQPPPRQ